MSQYVIIRGPGLSPLRGIVYTEMESVFHICTLTVYNMASLVGI